MKPYENETYDTQLNETQKTQKSRWLCTAYIDF